MASLTSGEYHVVVNSKWEWMCPEARGRSSNSSVNLLFSASATPHAAAHTQHATTAPRSWPFMVAGLVLTCAKAPGGSSSSSFLGFPVFLSSLILWPYPPTALEFLFSFTNIPRLIPRFVPALFRLVKIRWWLQCLHAVATDGRRACTFPLPNGVM